jgi:hypothetical protein
VTKKPATIDYAQFIALLTADFQEVVAVVDEYGKGLLHCEMGTFAGVTEKAIDAGEFARVERYIAFVDRVRKDASPDVQNAIDVSFIEYLAFSEMTDARYRAMKRMPPSLRRILLDIDGRDRWK